MAKAAAAAAAAAGAAGGGGGGGGGVMAARRCSGIDGRFSGMCGLTNAIYGVQVSPAAGRVPGVS